MCDKCRNSSGYVKTRLVNDNSLGVLILVAEWLILGRKGNKPKVIHINYCPFCGRDLRLPIK